MANDITNGLLQFALTNSNLARVAIEPNNIENENLRNANKLAISNKPNEKEAGTQLIRMMADDGNESAKNSIEHLEDLALKMTEQNSKNAQEDRKDKPAKEVLEQFKIDWSNQYYLDNGVKDMVRGWKKAASREFKIDQKTLNKILNKL